MTRAHDQQGGLLAAELERLAECEGGIRGGSERAAETMRQSARLIRALSPPMTSPAAGAVELRDFAAFVSSQMHNLPRSATANAVNERAQAILSALSLVDGGVSQPD